MNAGEGGPELPELPEFVEISGRGSRMIVRRGLEHFAPLMAPSGTPTAFMIAEEMASGGRQDHPVISLPGYGRVLIRVYRRGGLVGRFNRYRYFLGDRAFDELRATSRAAQGGVRVPNVVSAAQERVGFGYYATIATEWIEEAIDAERWIRSAGRADRHTVLTEMGRQVGLLHNAGVAHPDINLRNLLVVGPTGEAEPLVYLIDFDRARVSDGPTPPDRRRQDLLRLGRSARKLGLPLEEGDGWHSLRAGYGPEWPIGDLG